MTFLTLLHTSQDFAQAQHNVVRSEDRMTLTFRSSVLGTALQKALLWVGGH